MTIDRANEKIAVHRVNELADAFEDAWLAGLRPDLADFLDPGLDAQYHTELLKTLLELEMHYCQQNSLAFNADGLSDQFHEHSELIATIASDFARVSTLRNRPQALVPLPDDAMPKRCEEVVNLEDVAAFPPGYKFGRYEIVRPLGQGAMGTVFLAQDTTLHRSVALKLPRLRGASEQSIARFIREARVAACLQHPAICQIYDVGVEDQQHFISMAYLPGESLADRIKRDGPCTAEEAVRILSKLAMGLHSAHQNGVVHRDIKPANIMITEGNEPVLTDFGLARQMNSTEIIQLTHAGMILGSPAYMSPEQIRDSATTGPSSDIYSIGIVMYQMLTGQLPFRGELHSVIDRIKYELPAPLSTYGTHVPPTLEAICLRAIAKDPADRFASMLEFSEALSKTQLRSLSPSDANHLTDATPVQPAEVPQVSTKSISRATIGTALVGIALAVFGLWAAIIFFLPTKGGFIRVEINDPEIQVLVGDRVLSVQEAGVAAPIKVSAGDEHKLRIERGDFTFETSQFVLKSGETTRIQIDYLAGDVITKRDGEEWQIFETKTEPPAPTSDSTLREQSPAISRTLAPLSVQQQAEMQQLIQRGVQLLTSQQIEVTHPVTEQLELWAINCSLPINDAELELLLNAVVSFDRLVIDTELITQRGWDLLEQRYPPELDLKGYSPGSDAWKSISRMNRLKQLSIGYEKVNEGDVTAIGELVELEYLGFNFTSIEGTCFESFGRLQSLRNMDLLRTNVTDASLRHLGSLSSLRNLVLEETNIDGSGLAGLTNITALNLKGCKSLSSLKSLANLNLESLNLIDTPVTDISPLRRLPLVNLSIYYDERQHREVLQAIPTLERINDFPAEVVLGEVEQKER